MIALLPGPFGGGGAGFLIDGVENLANHVEGRHQIGAAVAHKQAHGFAHFGLQCLVAAHGADMAVKHHIIGLFFHRFFHIKRL